MTVFVREDVVTANDISELQYSNVSFDVSSEIANSHAVIFNDDGTKMYALGNSVHQYSVLGDPYDVSNVSYDAVSLNVSSEDTQPTGMVFNNEGSKLFVVGRETDSAYEYVLSTAFDLSTASFSGHTTSFPNDISDPAVRLSGNSQYANVGNVGVTFSGASPFSAECWIRTTSNTGGGGTTGHNYVMGTEESSGWFIRLSNGMLTVSMSDGTNTAIGTGNTVLTDNSSHHLVLVCNGSGGLLGYVNSSIQVDVTQNVGSMNSNVVLGGVASSLDVWGYDGDLDEPAVYNRALTDSEISVHYSVGISGEESLYRTEILDDDPVAYWRLGESSGTTAFDEQANDHDGTYNGDPTLGVSGAIVNDDDTAVTFDGTGDYVETTTLGSFGSNWADGVTFEAWAKWTSTAIGSIMGTVNDDSDMFVQFLVNADQTLTQSAGQVSIHLREGSGNTRRTASSNTSLNDGNWHHIVATFDPSLASPNDVTLYIDGQQDEGARNDSGGMTTFNNFDYPLDLAARNFRDVHDQQYDGSLDEVAVYEKVLTATQVESHYNTGTGT